MSIHYSPTTVTSGLVLCLDAGNAKSYPGSGTTWTDLSGNGNHGTLVNGPTFNSANGGSIVFDGANDVVDVANSANLNFTDKTSFTSWVKLSAYVVSGVGRIHGREGYIFEVAAGSITGAGGVPQGNIGIYTIPMAWKNTGYHLDLNTWYQVTVVFGGTFWQVYVNSVLVWTSGSTTINISGKIGIGSTYNATEGTNGLISSVSIYNRALSAAEIYQNFNALRGRYGV